MSGGLTTTDQQRLIPIHDFVFRDFERSRIMRIRDMLAEKPVFFSMAYLAVVFFWTAMMSYSAAKLGDPSPALNLTPHIAHFTMIIGILLYPKRLLWVPVVAFALVYLIPFSIPASDNNLNWFQIAAMTPQIIALKFLSILIAGALVGFSARLFCTLIEDRISPYVADLLTVLGVFAAFLVSSFVQLALDWQFAQHLSPQAQLDLGFCADFLHLGTERILRGGAVVSGFLLAILEISSRAALRRAIFLSPVFPLLALLQSNGFALYAPLDAAILSLLMVVVLPVPLAIGSCIVGVPMYSALTGNFVKSTHLHDASADMLEHYSIMIMLLTVLVPTLRAYIQHDLRHRMASLRRLSMVRDFADTGLLSFNLDHHRFRADASTQRIFTLPAEGNANLFIDLFEGEHRKNIANALKTNRCGSVTLLLSRKSATSDGGDQVLRIYLWYETAPSGEQVAYGLALDVSAEHDQERALQETLGELSSRQERQRQLFSIISHELRTPASVISMLVHDIEHGNLKESSLRQLRDATGQLMSTLADMRQTVNPTQNLPITKVNFAPAELAESIRNMFEPQAQEHGMQIRLNLCDSARLLRNNDQMRIRQALTNLVRNAIIHSKGTQIIIGFGMTEGPEQTSVWTVQDDGIGIAPQDVTRLFQPFERGLQDPRSQADGSGLGLFIAKSSAEALGGSLTYFAPTEGGAGYRMQLPDPIVLQTLQKQSVAPKDNSAARFPELYVLLAEDNQLVAEVTSALLAKFVGRIEVAGNGRLALEMMCADPPDVLITDLFMPEIDGDDLVRQIRGLGMTLPIVGATAAVVGDDVERFRAAGADLVMSKPLDFKELRNILSKIVPKSASVKTAGNR